MYEFALENLSKAVELNPNDYTSIAYLGHLAKNDGNTFKALNYYLSSLEINKNQPDIQFACGEIYDYLLKYEKAYDHFKRAAQQDPQMTLAYLGLSRTAALIGNKSEADQYFKQAYTLNQKRTIGLAERAEGLWKSRQYNRAVFILKQGIKANPADKELYYILASILRRRQEYKASIETLEKLIYYCPDEKRAYVHIAHMYYAHPILINRQKDALAGIYYLKKAIKLSPDERRDYEMLGELYHRLGMEKEYNGTQTIIEEKFKDSF
jgi:tetratricopeptide (TPR) repeat protein